MTTKIRLWLLAGVLAFGATSLAVFIRHERNIGAVAAETKSVKVDIKAKKGIASTAHKKLAASIAVSDSANELFWEMENALASDTGYAVPMPQVQKVTDAAKGAVLACSRVKLDCAEKVAADSAVIFSQDSLIKLQNKSIESATSKTVKAVGYTALGAAIGFTVAKIITK